MDQWQTTLISLARTLAIESGRTIAHLALLDGQRRSISWWQDAVLIGIRTEFEERGISQKVAADMLGISVRTYQRRYVEQGPVTSAHRTLWMSLYTRLSEETHANTIKGWFPGRTPEDISGILRDMTRSRWLLKREQSYRASRKSISWSMEMMLVYIATRKMFGASLEPDQLAQDTDVDASIWADMLAAHASEQKKRSLLKNIKHVAQARLLMHRTQVRMLMRHIREPASPDKLFSQMWVLPMPPRSDERHHAWFMERVKQFHIQQGTYFKAFIHELNTRYPSAKEDDFEHKFVWGSLAGTLKRDHDYDEVYSHESQ